MSASVNFSEEDHYKEMGKTNRRRKIWGIRVKRGRTNLKLLDMTSFHIEAEKVGAVR